MCYIAYHAPMYLYSSSCMLLLPRFVSVRWFGYFDELSPSSSRQETASAHLFSQIGLGYLPIPYPYQISSLGAAPFSRASMGASHNLAFASGISHVFIISGRLINCMTRPDSECHAMWQWNAHIPGLSVTKRIKIQPYPSTEATSRRSGFFRYA